MKTETVSILGVRVARMSLGQAAGWISAMIEQDKPRHIVTANAEIIYRAYREPEFFALLEKADLITADGAGVVLAARLLGYPELERVTGVDLVNEIFRLAEEKGWKIYFLGSRQDVLEKAVLNVLSNHPGVRIAGYSHGYYSQEETAEVVSNINRVKPDILLAALGSPKQEIFIRQHIKELNVPVSIGVGGSFDLLAGVSRRAPAWMRRHGLEWLYRLWREPRRYKRMLSLPRFVGAVLVHRIKGRKGS